MGRQLHVVVGRGGRARDRAAAVRSVTGAAESAGWTVEHLGLAELSHAAADLSRLVVIGGDGLLHRCLPLVAGRSVDVALVPVGSGNDFARALDLDHDSAVAAAAAIPDDASPALLDLVEVAIDNDDDGVAHAERNGSSRTTYLAASVVTGGFSGHVNELANRMRFPPGGAKYSVAAVREIGRLRPSPATVTLTGSDGAVSVVKDELTMFAVGNTAFFGGGMQICPEADPTDGLLDVVTVGPISSLQFARWLPKVFKGGHTSHSAVGVHRVASVTIETTHAPWADGEPLSAPGGQSADDAEPVARRVSMTARRGALRLLGVSAATSA